MNVMHEHDDSSATYEAGKEWETVLHVDNPVRAMQQGVPEPPEIDGDFAAAIEVPDLVPACLPRTTWIGRTQHCDRPPQHCKASCNLLHEAL